MLKLLSAKIRTGGWRALFGSCCMVMVAMPGIPAEEIGFVETYALAENRAQALEQLIPGTEDYYFYHCLYAQQQGDQAAFEEMLQRWIKRHKVTSRVKELQLRQALLEYPRDPQGSLDFLKKELQLTFNHERVAEDQKSDAPTRVDPKLLSAETLLARAFKRHKNLNGIEDAGLGWLVDKDLNPDRQRDWLGRLKRPDVPGLAEWVVADLRREHSQGFGSLAAHRVLTLEQLQACAVRMPELLKQDTYVRAVLKRMQPGADQNPEHDPAVQEGYLTRLWDFVQTLDPVHNPLKVHVLYQRLQFDRTQGRYDPDRFLHYLRLPRQAPYVEPGYLRRKELMPFTVTLNEDYENATGFKPVQRDEALVRDYLLHLLVEAPDYQAYTALVKEDVLKKLFAEAKILSGKGDPEQWASYLTPSEFQHLKDRVDIQFSLQNPRYVGPEDPVQLGVSLKNTGEVLIKIYQINTFNFYREQQKEVDTAIHLDGLVATVERALTLEGSSFLRQDRQLDFPELADRGVYVVELIGNGRSSRAVIRKGRLHLLERPTEAGHEFTVLDEQARPVKDARMWIAQRVYEPDEDGHLLVPYTVEPGVQPVIIQRGAFCSLGRFRHQAEQYAFSCGMYIDRETLLKAGRATAVLRPVLSVNGMPVSPNLLEEVRLTLTTTDQDGISSATTVSPFALAADRESEFVFPVPDQLRSVQLALDARIQNISRNEKEDLAASATVTLNAVDDSSAVLDTHVSRSGEGYVLEVLGKNGEARAHLPVVLKIKHAWFKEPVDVSVQTDGAGRIDLGALPHVDYVQITGPDQHASAWHPERDRCERRGTLHGLSGEVLRVPVLGTEEQAGEVASLFELRPGVFAHDRSDHLTLAQGFLELRDLAPGDYELWLKSEQTALRVRVTDGHREAGYALSGRRGLEHSLSPLHMPVLVLDKEALRIQLAYAGKFTRVHVFGTQVQPAYNLFASLGFSGTPEPMVQGFTPPESHYLSGRNIGDEYRYILERKTAPRYPGNLLERPSLLLNPWSLGDTDAAEDVLAQDEDFAKLEGGTSELARKRKLRQGGQRGEASPSYPNLDFLDRPAAVLLNLVPGEDGVVVVDRKLLAGMRQVRVMAVDPGNSVVRELALPEANRSRRDLRMARILDPNRRLTERKLVTTVTAGETFRIDHPAGARLEIFDSLDDVYRYFLALHGGDALAEFSFLLDWPDLPAVDKAAHYSKQACHEFNLFLSRKDPAFFKAVVQPYLANKREKTFMDHWLLEQDVSAYLEPDAFMRLNAAEKALLGTRMQAQQATLARHLLERYDLIAPDPERFDRLFRAAMSSGNLEDSGLAMAWESTNSTTWDLDPFASNAFGDMDGDSTDEFISMNGAGVRSSKTRNAGRTRFAALGIDAKTGKGIDKNLPMETESLYVMNYDTSVLDTMDFAITEDRYVRLAGMRAQDRAGLRRLFMPMDKTEEWAETQYYRIPPQFMNSALVPVSAFWKERAAWDGEGAFLSGGFIEASAQPADMLLTLALLDLPFRADTPRPDAGEGALVIEAKSPLIVFHQEVRESDEPDQPSPVLVTQNFFRADDRYRFEGNEQFDKLVTGEFLRRVVYGCQVVLTNPSSAPLKLDVLLQIPRGALPVQSGFTTRGFPVRCAPFSTQTMEYFFYFPETGTFPQFPAQVSRHQEQWARAEPATFTVVDKLSQVDREAWPWLSQNGSDAEVLAFLDRHNLERLDLEQMAFRMKDPAFFSKALALLRERHVFQPVLWSYAVLHNDAGALREYLVNTPLVDRCGKYLQSGLLDLDPVEQRRYQHLEYHPLVNPRTHRVGTSWNILNHRFRTQYQAYMDILGYKPALDAEDRLAVTYYFFLQDRVEEALDQFARVDRDQIVENMPYDYVAAYAAMSRGASAEARKLAEAYVAYPVPRWQKRFQQVLNQLDEADGGAIEVADEENREQEQDRLAATQPTLELKVESGVARVEYHHLKSGRLNFYPMDIELLFSRKPFVQQQSGQFSFIKPRVSREVDLPGDGHVLEIPLPEALRSSNVMVEIVAGGLRRSQAYYANALAIQTIEPYGQLIVSHRETRRLLPATYVKVYARLADGREVFYKDGYTDIRGRFDYATLNAGALGGEVERFALLVLHDEHGAVIREAQPPKL